MNKLLSYAYDGVDEKKAARLRECAENMVFKWNTETKECKLGNGNFCRVRLCPMCMWRRSLKVQSQMHQILEAIKADTEKGGKEYAFTYMTLTIRNVEGDKLGEALDEMGAGFKRLMETDVVRKATFGYYKSLEVTHKIAWGDEWHDTYHPHLHAVLVVDPGYFSGRRYIKHERWQQMWKKAMRLDYDPSVKINRVKGVTAKAVAEAAGYGVKSCHYIIPDDWDLTVDTVRLLDKVLHKRRFVSFGGLLRKYHQKLGLCHPEGGDLVNVSGKESEDIDSKVKKVYVAWFSGYRQYRVVG